MSDAVRGIAYPLYQRVERERALRGWSSTRLHKETGVSRSTIGKWATQQQPPQPGTVNAVADVLGIDRAEALRLAGVLTEVPAAPFSDDELDRFEAEVGVDLHHLDPSVRRDWLAYGAALVRKARADAEAAGRGREERRGA